MMPDRSQHPTAHPTADSPVRLPSHVAFGAIAVDFDRGRMTRAGEPVPIPLKELQLLRYLVAKRGVVVSREELLHEVWDYHAVTTRTVDVHVAGLRHKIEDNPRSPRYLLTIRGGGYMFLGESTKILRTA